MPCVEGTSELGSKRAVTSQLMNMPIPPYNDPRKRICRAGYDSACSCGQIAMGSLATFLAACERWPGTPITLRQGASTCGVWESVAAALAETMAESAHYDIDSTTVRAHVSAAGGKGGFINELLAAR